MIATNHAIGVSFGLLCWALVYYLHFHDKLPVRHTILIAVLGTVQIFLSLDLVVTPAEAARWDIIAYFILTMTAVATAFRGRYRFQTLQAEQIHEH